MKAALVVLVACLAPTAFARATNVYCVASAANLTNALASLSTSAANSDADEIRIRTGTYSAPAGGWVGAVTTHHDLTIRGGYTDAECTQQALDASLTVLDGNDAAGVMTINTPLQPNSNIEVSGLTFQHGKGGNAFESSAGALKIGDPNPISGGKILIERNIFRDNAAAIDGFSTAVGALVAATDGESLILRGNLFINNSAPGAAAASLYSNSEIDVSNNTFAGNHSTDTTQPTLDYTTFTGLFLSNNIFWGNTTALDVNLHNGAFGVGATAKNNDIETPVGTAVAEAGALHVNPDFVGNGDFRLSAASLLIDAGAAGIPGGLASVDLDGAPRVDAIAVDLGAYESSYIFVDSFE